MTRTIETEVSDAIVDVPRALPGHHLPHFWLPGAARRSTTDLPQLAHFVLIVDDAASAWLEAASHLEHPLATSLAVTAIPGEATSPDHVTTWGVLREVGPTGALLVRPDGIIAWRWSDLPADPRAALLAALDHTGATAATADAGRSATLR